MKKTLPLLAISALLAGCTTVSYQQNLDSLPGETLAVHQTLARYEGVTQEPCRHMTADCPNACEHGGLYAHFTIVEYTGYEHRNKYGDPKQTEFVVRFAQKDGRPDADIAPPLQKMILELDEGQMVKLDWHHVLIEDETGSYPKRIIVQLAE